jgi:DsbC/DsbD-like thiol-disulfide interchange protein
MNAFWFPLAIIACALVTQDAQGAETAWVDTGKAQVRLHADATRAAIEIRMPPRWHTYWRYPGDAGVPPRFDWSGSENLESATVRYPTPRRFKEAAGQIIGYEDRVIFPIMLKTQDPSKPIKLKLKFEFAVCEKICIPAEAEFAISTRPGVSPLINEAEKEIPVPQRLGGTPPSILSVKLRRDAKPSVLVEVETPPGEEFDLFAEGPTHDWSLPLPEKIETKQSVTRYAIPVEGAPSGAAPIPSRIRLTLYAGKRAVETEAFLD